MLSYIYVFVSDVQMNVKQILGKEVWMGKKQFSFQEIFNGGVDNETYMSVMSRVQRTNRNMLTVMAALASAILATLYAVSFFVMALEHNRWLYLTFAVLMLGIFLLAKFQLKRHQQAVLPVFYVFLITAYLFSMILGILMQSSTPSTTFCVLLAILPMLIIDKPWRVSILLFVVGVTYSVATLKVKSPDVAALDIVNVVSFLILGIAVNYFDMRMKISEAVSRRHIEKERDTDDLTRLMTKAAANREIEVFLEERTSAVLMLLDIDNFKQVNDLMGHAYGDTVLRKTSEILRIVFRDTDILSRFGGDEFVLFLPGIGDRDVVEARVKTLMSMLEMHMMGSEQDINITASVGIAMYPQDAGSYDELFQKADEALYASKRKGKNGYTFYQEQSGR